MKEIIICFAFILCAFILYGVVDTLESERNMTQSSQEKSSSSTSNFALFE